MGQLRSRLFANIILDVAGRRRVGDGETRVGGRGGGIRGAPDPTAPQRWIAPPSHLPRLPPSA